MHSNNRQQGKNIFKCLPTPSFKKKSRLQLGMSAVEVGHFPALDVEQAHTALPVKPFQHGVTKGNPVSSKLLTRPVTVLIPPLGREPGKETSSSLPLWRPP